MSALHWERWLTWEILQKTNCGGSCLGRAGCVPWYDSSMLSSPNIHNERQWKKKLSEKEQEN